MSERHDHFMPMYAGAIHEAIRSGDVEAMRALSRRARTEGAGDPEIKAAAAELDAELARLGGTGDGGVSRTLYGGPIHEAIRSGDVEAMRALSQRARTEGTDDPEIQAAVAELERELARLGGAGGNGGTSHTLYAGPIHEAQRSGDLQQMLAVQSRAQREGGSDPEIQAALQGLNQEIQRLRGS
jgi:hypothetical protein